MRKVKVYCFENKQSFNSLTEAAAYINTDVRNIKSALDKPTRTASGFHWCTDLSKFNPIDPYADKSTRVFCWETKQEFKSRAEALRSGLVSSSNGLSLCLNNPNKTAGGYHWCTDLELFKNKILTTHTDKVRVCCFETGEWFDSCTEAANNKGIWGPCNIARIIDNPYMTAGGYHWVSDPNNFTPKNTGSSIEEAVQDILKDTGFYFIKSRNLIPKMELDFYCKQINLAIEVNGSYWHREDRFGKIYHQQKYLECEKRNIHLLQFFEYDINNKLDIIKSVIYNKIGLSSKIYARKCEVIELDNCDKFLRENHMQGKTGGGTKVNLGLKYNDELVAVMTFGNPRFNKKYQWELYRFCSKLHYSVVGGAAKLLSYFEKKYKPINLISYANLQWSNGNLYNKLGFNKLALTRPGYVYVNKDKVLSRYKCQKHKLKNFLNKFDDNLTEVENMRINNYYRVFDCGNIVFEKRYLLD